MPWAMSGVSSICVYYMRTLLEMRFAAVAQDENQGRPSSQHYALRGDSALQFFRIIRTIA